VHFLLYVGLYSVTGPVYVSEMSPSNIRGKLGLASFLNTGGGILIGSIMVGLFSIDSKQAYTIGWRLVYAWFEIFVKCTDVHVGHSIGVIILSDCSTALKYAIMQHIASCSNLFIYLKHYSAQIHRCA